MALPLSTPLVATAVAVFWSPVDPLPSSPIEPLPQQYARPALTAHAWLEPRSSVAADVAPLAAAGRAGPSTARPVASATAMSSIAPYRFIAFPRNPRTAVRNGQQ